MCVCVCVCEQNLNTDLPCIKLVGDIDVRHAFILVQGSGPGRLRGHSSVLLHCSAEHRWSSLLHVGPTFRGNGGWVLFGLKRATGVETIRQALVCLHGREDTVSD